MELSEFIKELLKSKVLPKKKYKKGQVFHDLDYLAGSWNKEDVKEFKNILKDTEKIDKELWK